MEDPSKLDQDALLGDLGLDSLMGVEIRQTLDSEFGILLSMKDVRSVSDFGFLLARQAI